MSARLPIDEVREEVLRAVQPDRPLIVSAPTGSGKSTRLPLWLAERAEGSGELVVVVEPRRVACTALAGFLARQRGEQVGQHVGYSVRFDDRRSAKTRVLFVTPGVALRMLQGPEPPAWAAVLLDEFHERSWQMDLTATLLREHAARGWDRPIVLTSATLDVEGLQASLGARVVEAGGRTFPVDVRYAGEEAQPSGRDLDARVARAVRRALADSEGDGGDILVFLPGKGEIERCEGALKGLAGMGTAAQVVPVHAGLPAERLARAFGEREVGEPRRVFLSTNVAETSVTLPQVTWVIDSGLARMQLHRGGRQALAVVPISEASMAQRAGRAGRVRPGVCVRLWEASYRADVSTPPEIERVELDDVLLQAAACGLPASEVEAVPWVTPPPTFAVARAVERLTQMQAIDAQGRLTERGARLVTMPVSAYEARMLLDPPPELAADVADLVAIQQRGGGRLLLHHASAEQREARAALFEGCRHEVAEVLTALRRGDPRKHALHRSALQETRRIAASLREQLGVTPADPSRDPRPLPDDAALARHLLSRAPEAAFVLRERARRERPTARRGAGPTRKPWANGQVEVFVRPYTPHHRDDQQAQREPEAGALLAHAWLGDDSGYGVRGVGSLLLPCRPALLAELGLGDELVDDPRMTRARGDVHITGTVRRELAGVTLSSREEALTGRALCHAAATFILDRRLFADAVDPLLDRLHLADLLAQWSDMPPDPDTAHWDLKRLSALPQPTPHAHLAERLHTLGLRHAEELALIEPDDLLPDLEGMSGLMAFELDALLDELPRTFEHLGVPYTCEITLRSRHVVIRPATKAARRAQEPPVQVLPRFRGFRISYEQDSRRLTLRR